MRPRSSRTRHASSTVLRLTPNWSRSRRTDGMRSPHRIGAGLDLARQDVGQLEVEARGNPADRAHRRTVYRNSSNLDGENRRTVLVGKDRSCPFPVAPALRTRWWYGPLDEPGYAPDRTPPRAQAGRRGLLGRDHRRRRPGRRGPRPAGPTPGAEQAQAGIDSIPSNDFSLYDQVLDTTCLVGAVPPRFGHHGGPVDLDTYFALARGTTHGAGADARVVAPLEMTKWFDTNYHYLVPELGPTTAFALSSTKPVDEFTRGPGPRHRDPARPRRARHLSPVWPSHRARVLPPGAPPRPPRCLRPGPRRPGRRRGPLGPARRALSSAPIWTTRPARAVDFAYAALSRRTLKILVATYFSGLGRQPGAGHRPARGRAPRRPRPRPRPAPRPPRPPRRRHRPLGRRGRRPQRLAHRSVAHPASPGRGPGAAGRPAVGGSLLLAPARPPRPGVRDRPPRPPGSAGWPSPARSWTRSPLLTRGLVARTRGRRRGAGGQRRRAGGARRPSAAGDRRRVRRRVAALSARRRPASLALRAPPGASSSSRSPCPCSPPPPSARSPRPTRSGAARQRHAAGELTDDDYRTFCRDEIARVIAQQEDLGLDVLVHGEPERNDMVQYFGEHLDGFACTSARLGPELRDPLRPAPHPLRRRGPARPHDRLLVPLRPVPHRTAR